MSDSGLLILHLSDLHFGENNRFNGQNPAELGETFAKGLQAVKPVDSPVQLVIVSGDIAETGHKKEFRAGEAFLKALALHLEVPKERFLFVPGNHDVSWESGKMLDKRIEEEEETSENYDAKLTKAKLKNYREFLENFYENSPANHRRPLIHDSYIHEYLEFNLSVATLNSCEKESHKKQIGYVSLEQKQAVMDYWMKEYAQAHLKILVVHHNPISTTTLNRQDMETKLKNNEASLPPEKIERYVADLAGFDTDSGIQNVIEDTRAHLVLFGHHHDMGKPAPFSWRDDPINHGVYLSTGSLCLAPDSYCQLLYFKPEGDKLCLAIHPLRYDIRVRPVGQVQQGGFRLDRHISQPCDRLLELPSSWKSIAITDDGSSLPANIEGFLQKYRYVFSEDFAAYKYIVRPDTKESLWLDDMYYPLHFVPAVSTSSEERQVFSVERLLENLKPENFIERKTKKQGETVSGPAAIAIEGGAGTGKTTWVQYTFRQLFQKESVLPLLVTLREFLSESKVDKNASLLTYLQTIAERRMEEPYPEALKQILTSHLSVQPVLLVDGWDELGASHNFTGKLRSFMREFPRVLVVVTSRPYGEGRPVDEIEWYKVDPLKPEEIEEFAQRYFGRCHPEQDIDKSARFQNFKDSLKGSPEAAELAKTMLLLSMMLGISYSAVLPEQRHKLYRVCVKELLNRRSSDTPSPQNPAESAPAWRPPSIDACLRVLRRVAYAIQTEHYGKGAHQQIFVTRPQMDDYLIRSMKNEEGFAVSDSASFIDWLVQTAGLLTDRTDKEEDSLAFLHLSFQEFLTAEQMEVSARTQESIKEEMAKWAKVGAWRDTLRLWCAIVSEALPDNLSPALTATTPANPALAGMIFADGAGTLEKFQEWNRLFTPSLARPWLNNEIGNCLSTWRASRQKDRKEAITAALNERAASANWMEWLRLQHAAEIMGLLFDATPQDKINSVLCQNFTNAPPPPRKPRPDSRRG